MDINEFYKRKKKVVSEFSVKHGQSIAPFVSCFKNSLYFQKL